MVMGLSASHIAYVSLALLYIVSTGFAGLLGSQQKILDLQPNPITVSDRLGAVASENSVCSQIGIDLLKGGGNAADAVRHLWDYRTLADP